MWYVVIIQLHPPVINSRFAMLSCMYCPRYAQHRNQHHPYVSIIIIIAITVAIAITIDVLPAKLTYVLHLHN